MHTIVRRSMRMTLWAMRSVGSAIALPVATIWQVSTARRRLDRVDVDAVEAGLVLDDETAVLVDEAGVELRHRRLGQADVVLARPAQGVQAGLQREGAVGDAAPHHLEQAHREVGPAAR